MCVSYRPASSFYYRLGLSKCRRRDKRFYPDKCQMHTSTLLFLVLLMLFKVPLQTVQPVRNRCGRSLPAQHSIFIPTLCFTQKVFFFSSSHPDTNPVDRYEYINCTCFSIQKNQNKFLNNFLNITWIFFFFFYTINSRNFNKKRIN